MSNFKSSLTKNLKPYSKNIPEINKATMRSLLKLCVAFLEHQKYSKEAYDKEIIKISALNSAGSKDYDLYCTIIMILLETFLKSRRSGDDLSEALRELKFQDECVEDLSKVLISNQQSLHEHFLEMKLEKAMKLEYRINISLMEIGQQPTIILHLEHKGQVKTMNLSLKQFHRFRLAIASALAELQALEDKKA